MGKLDWDKISSSLDWFQWMHKYCIGTSGLHSISGRRLYVASSKAVGMKIPYRYPAYSGICTYIYKWQQFVSTRQEHFSTGVVHVD